MPVSPLRVCPVLIQREPEIETLKSLLTGALSGHAQTVVVSGEAGVGKSRLVSDIARHARARGFDVLSGNCLERDRDYPFGPFIDAMRREQHPTASRVAGVPQRQPRNDGVIAVEEITPSRTQTRREMFDAITAAIADHATASPILLILEDLHWADPTSLELLEILPRRLTECPVLILGSTRANESPPELTALLTSLRRQRLVTELSLQPLDLAAVTEMVERILGKQVGTTLAAEIHRRTSGNPFFVEELLATLPEGVTANWILGEHPLPSNLQQILTERLRGLDPTAVRLLHLAAVAGQQMSYDLLAATASIPEVELIAGLRRLVDAQILFEDRSSTAMIFAFRHALVREAVLSTLLRPELRILHLLVAEALEAQIAASPAILPNELAGELGYHFHAAGAWERALPYAEIAGEAAWRIQASLEALRHSLRALDAALALGDPRAGALHLRCGLALQLLGDFHEARHHLDAARERATQTGQLGDAAAALIGLSSLAASRDYDESHRFALSALETANQTGDPDLISRARNRLGNVLVNLGKFSDGRGMHEAALRQVQAKGDRWGTADCWDLIGMARYLAGDVPDARSAFGRAVDLFTELGDRERLASALTSRGLYLAVLDGVCESDAAPSDFEHDAVTGLAICRQLAWRAGEAYALVARSTAALGAGRFGEARLHGEHALAIAQDIAHEQWQVIALLNLGIQDVEMQDLAGAMEWFLEARRIAVAARAEQWRERIDAWIAWCEGDVERAGQIVDRGRTLTGAGSIGQRRALMVLGEAALASGDWQSGLDLVESLLGGAAGPRSVGALLLRSDILAAIGRDNEADAGYLEARRIATAVGPRTMLWRIAAGRARLWAGRDPETGRSEAAIARTELLALANSIPGEASRAEFLAAPLIRPWIGPSGRRRTASQAAAGGLTPRELSVAMLVARGLSNKEIAGELAISEKTVEMHVSSCLGKLEFGSRAQLAAWVVGEQLIVPASPRE
jgi:DNA-binding CsgD family transcriptional regulator/tetratricopeptide (TPR) repeat protein